MVVLDTHADSLRKCAVLNHCAIFLTHSGVRPEVANWVVKTAQVGFHNCIIWLF